MHHEIFIDENIPLLAETLQTMLPANAVITRFAGRGLRQEHLRRCTALFVRSITRVDADLLAGTPVRFVGTATSGKEHIDTAWLAQEGIVFADARGCNANSVAEYVLAAIAEWAYMHGLTTLAGKTLGVVGFGHIGKRVAALAQTLGLRVLVNDPPLIAASGAGNVPYPHSLFNVELAQLLVEADICTNHIPLEHGGNFPTALLFGEEECAFLQPNSLFIHASRGGIVCESALLRAMHRRGVAAAVDVWEAEPRINPALTEAALFATPHIAGYSFEGKINGSIIMAERYAAFTGGTPDMAVLHEALQNPHRPVFNLQDIGQLREHLRSSRRFHEDTENLRAVVRLPESEQVQGFDRLRREYAVRREIISFC